MTRGVVRKLQKIKHDWKSIASKNPKDSKQIQLSKAKNWRDKQKHKRQEKLKKTLIKRIALIINRSNSHIHDIILINSGQKKATVWCHGLWGAVVCDAWCQVADGARGTRLVQSYAISCCVPILWNVLGDSTLHRRSLLRLSGCDNNRHGMTLGVRFWRRYWHWQILINPHHIKRYSSMRCAS